MKELVGTCVICSILISVYFVGLLFAIIVRLRWWTKGEKEEREDPSAFLHVRTDLL